MMPCCWNHDGPHVHGCVLPRTAYGSTHAGPCTRPAWMMHPGKAEFAAEVRLAQAVTR